ncbi:sn-glycerol-3-phosphate ABC transporter ATP-binding protein UgpC [Psychromarinibacter sp. C21-152]|uniref:Sn-glycerol-3-phosphate ABC transporter ATP-binding protein UgpC n=1 Tax=Psychromarinibacter sediminicola TaxID=3033385 RepID=A0AAE3T8G9_9RHOB|nr:sn-glycerol-3-phosphate ABC transporter ATP-binding protein UgpC [Psychromarinibacter sediminicola]MDF0601252.1 sn-glycerol-3-phosphate ABC transporter ATP-binding protein UgpC [Psychromarinibacter sediminicola]
MAPLTVRQATKSFGSVQVLHGVDVDIEDGEFVVLVGPSGCGKSTLLRLIAGLEDITSGDILIDGKVVSRLHPKDRDIAMVFQSYALYPHMTVAENMGFSLRMRDVGKSEQDRKVREAAGILGLTDLLDRYPRQLSGGQRQRVAMGRAIVRDPKVFLFDEPLSNLDAKLRVQMRAEIRELQKALRTTIVYVTHDQIEAMTMADKIVVMRDGRVEQIGSPLELYDRPANMFVGGFIGSPAMNLLHGRVSEDGRSFTTDDGADIAFSEAVSPAPGRQAVLGLRPEDFTIADGGTPATIRLIEPTGADLLINFDLGGEPITALFHERLALREGETVGLSVPSNKVHFFDPDSGARIE